MSSPYPLVRKNIQHGFIVLFTSPRKGEVVEESAKTPYARDKAKGYVSTQWADALDSIIWENVPYYCRGCGKQGILYANGYCSQGCQDSKKGTPMKHPLKPTHYKQGKDSFAWAEEQFDTNTCLAIAAFNIHKYNERNKGQDYEDFGKITVYAEWARSMMEKPDDTK